MSREYEFDSSGGTFVYFALSIVCLYLIPATISRVSAALAGNDGSARALALADEDKNQADGMTAGLAPWRLARGRGGVRQWSADVALAKTAVAACFTRM